MVEGAVVAVDKNERWQSCPYCKEGKVPRSNTPIMDDCPECEGLGGYFVVSYNVVVEPVLAETEPFVSYDDVEPY